MNNAEQASSELDGFAIGPFFLAWRDYERRRRRSQWLYRVRQAILGRLGAWVLVVLAPGFCIWQFDHNLIITLVYCAGAWLGLAVGGVLSSDANTPTVTWFSAFEKWVMSRSDEELLKDAREWVVGLSVYPDYERDVPKRMERNAIAAECWRRGILSQLEDVPYALPPAVWRSGSLPD